MPVEDLQGFLALWDEEARKTAGFAASREQMAMRAAAG
jgi:hypothetical protein